MRGCARSIFSVDALKYLLLALVALYGNFARAQEHPLPVNYLGLGAGVIPVAVEGDAKELKVGMEEALQAIDGNDGPYVVTSKPGGEQTKVVFVYKLPAMTIFNGFSVPNVLETPSPFQTFFKRVVVAGSESGPSGPFSELASIDLNTHAAKAQSTSIPVVTEKAVRWVRLSLQGGINVLRDKTYFEFSEIIGHGTQEAVPLFEGFDGKWKGRGVLVELKQDGASVSGCYDRVGDITGTVSGNLLRATGRTRNGGIPSGFVLAVGDAGQLIGVRSSNGAPFRLYSGEAAPDLKTECSGMGVQPLGCGSIIHGITFDYDSAKITPESARLVQALAAGLQGSTASAITVVGHTSSEGSDTYNKKLSQRRAQAVVTALAAQGIDAGRVSAEGRGEQQPIADNATEAGRALNRRVEIECR